MKKHNPNSEPRFAKPTFNLASIAAGKKEPQWHNGEQQVESEQLEKDNLENEVPQKRKKLTPLNRAVWYLARREHSKVELITKLTAKGVELKDAEEAIQKLEEMGLQSDQRYLESQVRQRFSNGYGPQKLKVELNKHKLSESSIQEAIFNPENEWKESAKKLVESRYGKGKLPLKEQTKAFNMLMRRGFSYEIAKYAISGQ